MGAQTQSERGKLEELLWRNSKAPAPDYDELVYSMKQCVSVRKVNGFSSFPRLLEDKCAGVTTSA